MIINAATFILTETQTYGEMGTVEVTLGKETRRVLARRTANYITAYEFGGRYETGTKVWPASVSQHYEADGKVWESADFGRDDRHPKFNKMRGVFLPKKAG